MLENSKADTSRIVATGQSEDGLSRRRLIRAGLASAPVMLGLKSPSALAGTGTHMTCSVWASMKTSAVNSKCRSNVPTVAGSTCTHYSAWTNTKWNSNTHCKKKYHNSTSACVPFNGAKCGTKSLQQVCAGSGITDATLDKLARHCSSMYLNIKVNGSCPLTETEIKTLWDKCGNSSAGWTPFVGCTPWTAADCNAYFDYVCKGTKPSNWPACV